MFPWRLAPSRVYFHDHTNHPVVNTGLKLKLNLMSGIFTRLYYHSLRYKEFLEAVAGTAPVKPYVPFVEALNMVGLVTSLVCEEGETDATWGVVTVESGYISSPNNKNRGVISIVGKNIAFHRSVFWIFGRSTRKAVDLALCLQK